MKITLKGLRKELKQFQKKYYKKTHKWFKSEIIEICDKHNVWVRTHGCSPDKIIIRDRNSHEEFIPNEMNEDEQKKLITLHPNIINASVDINLTIEILNEVLEYDVVSYGYLDGKWNG